MKIWVASVDWSMENKGFEMCTFLCTTFIENLCLDLGNTRIKKIVVTTNIGPNVVF